MDEHLVSVILSALRFIIMEEKMPSNVKTAELCHRNNRCIFFSGKEKRKKNVSPKWQFCLWLHRVNAAFIEEKYFLFS